MIKNIILISLVASIVSLSMSSGMGSGKEKAFISSWIKEGIVQEDHITVSARVLTKEECKHHLRANVPKWGYQPIQITIDNHTESTYLLSPESIDLPTASSNEISRNIIRDSIPRAVVFNVLGFLFFPFSIAGTMSSFYTNKAYRSMKKTLRIREVKTEKVQPYTVYHRIFFVPVGEFKDSFSISLQEEESLQTHVFQTKGEIRLESLPVVEENYYLTHGS